MPIIISRINELRDDENLYEYRVCLNGIELGRFTHDRNMGMGACLRDAARALDRVDIDATIIEAQFQGRAERLMRRLADQDS